MVDAPGGTLALGLLRPLARCWYEAGKFAEAGDWTLRLLDHTAGDELLHALTPRVRFAGPQMSGGSTVGVRYHDANK